MNFVCEAVSYRLQALGLRLTSEGQLITLPEGRSWHQYQRELAAVSLPCTHAHGLPVPKPSEQNSSFFHLKLCLWLFCFRQKTDLAAVLLFSEQSPCNAKTSSLETAE